MTRDKTKDVIAKNEQPTGIVGSVRNIRMFFEESKVEIKKVVWPTRNETIATCIAVLVLVLAMSLFLGIVDLGFSKLIAVILS